MASTHESAGRYTGGRAIGSRELLHEKVVFAGLLGLPLPALKIMDAAMGLRDLDDVPWKTTLVISGTLVVTGWFASRDLEKGFVVFMIC